VQRVGNAGGWLVVAAAGAVVLLLSLLGARGPGIGATERRVFLAVNGLTDRLYTILWAPMQLGNLVVGTLVGIAVALVAGDVAVAVGVLAAAGLKLLIERVIRHETAGHLPARRRPGTSEPGAVLRGDVPVDGPSFPSGHVILAAAAGCVVAPVLSPPLTLVAGVLVAAVAVGRVYVAAHNPLDVTAGLGAGVLVGGLVSALLTA
jgi:membrane-associated phospholipid phosphatase